MSIKGCLAVFRGRVLSAGRSVAAALRFEGERNEVGEYLDARGWRLVGISMEQLLADFGFPAMPRQDDGTSIMADVIYYTSILN